VPARLQTVCLRHEALGFSGWALDRHTLGWAERIDRSGAAYLTLAVVDGRWMVRVSIGVIVIEREDVSGVWKTIHQGSTADHCRRG
jgi:aromatic-L-amino-acid decarboxylase